MKSLIFLVLSLYLFHNTYSQYYYKDIVATRESESRAGLLKKSRIRNVQLNSFEADGTATEAFTGTQTICVRETDQNNGHHGRGEQPQRLHI